MFRKPDRMGNRYTEPDHRPMIPELRQPNDELDAAVREVRRSYDAVNPNHNQNWR